MKTGNVIEVYDTVCEERENGIAMFRCNSFGDISHLYAAEEPLAFAGRFCEMYANFEERH